MSPRGKRHGKGVVSLSEARIELDRLAQLEDSRIVPSHQDQRTTEGIAVVGIFPIELHCPLGELQGIAYGGLARIGITADPLEEECLFGCRISTCKAGIYFQRAPEQSLRLGKVFPRALVGVPKTPLVELPRMQIVGPSRTRSLALGLTEFRLDGARQRAGDLVLHG